MEPENPQATSLTSFPYLARLEWESLDCGDLREFATLGAPLPAGTLGIEIARSEDFSLTATATGEFEDVGAFRRFLGEFEATTTAGTISRGRVLDCSNDYENVRIEGASILQHHTSPLADSAKLGFEIDLDLCAFHWEEKGKSASWQTDWLLNGPRDFIWRRASSRSGEVKYERRWKHHRGEKAVVFPGARHEPGAVDHFHVESDAAKFTVHRVPPVFGPGWSKNIGIEYEKKSDGTFPDPDTRDAIIELVSFLIGRRLIHVGSTGFDDLGYPIAVMARQPWGNNVQSVCETDDLPPINIARDRGGANIEDALASLLPTYLKLRSTLRLGDVLWRLWLGNEAPLGIDLPIFSAGFDMIAGAWFKSSASKSKGVYMPMVEFERLLDDAFKIASERLADAPHGDRMLRRMKGSFQTSVSERTEWFFEEIGLPLGNDERAAMKARNSPAHGGDRGASHKEIDALIRHGAAYRSLFARTLLKILGYDGKYIDRRTVGFPLRHLQQPAGN